MMRASKLEIEAAMRWQQLEYIHSRTQMKFTDAALACSNHKYIFHEQLEFSIFKLSSLAGSIRKQLYIIFFIKGFERDVYK